MAPLVNDPIMQKRSIWSFRYLECQNPSFISDSMGIPNEGRKSEKMSEELAESYSYRRGCPMLGKINSEY